jgi:hypothetical protein
VLIFCTVFQLLGTIMQLNDILCKPKSMFDLLWIGFFIPKIEIWYNRSKNNVEHLGASHDKDDSDGFGRYTSAK